MDHHDLTLFRFLWKLITFVIWSRLWIGAAIIYATYLAGMSIWGDAAVAMGLEASDWMQVSAGSYLFFIVPILAADAYLIAFWVRGLIRKILKDPAWTYFGRSEARNARGGIDALKGNKPASEVTSGRPRGVVFGQIGRKWVCRKESAGDMVLVFGAPGTGKSQALALPSLSVFDGGLLCIDIKGELWHEVGSHQQGAKRFAVEDAEAFGFDPFSSAYESEKKRHDVARTIALTLVPDNPAEKDPYWTQQAQNLLTASLLTGLEQGYTFIQTMDIVCQAGGDELVKWISKCGDIKAATYNSSFGDMDRGKTLPSVYSTLHGKVALFAVDDDVRECFSRQKTISPADLRDGGKLYICLPENKLEQWKTLTAMLVKLFLKDAETWENNRAQKTLFLVDEMPRLGKLPAITNSLATLRSKGCCIVLICQSIAQLRALYGKDETDAIVDLCAMKAILSASGETAELCSRLVGESVQQLANKGANAPIFDPLKRNTSSGTSEQWHAIMQGRDFQHLGDDLVLIEPRSGALKVRKMPYWKHRGEYVGQR